MGNVMWCGDKLYFHPGSYISEIIEDQHLDFMVVSGKLGLTLDELQCLVNGERDVDLELAEKLSEVFCVSVKLWLNLQNAWDNKMVEEKDD